MIFLGHILNFHCKLSFDLQWGQIFHASLRFKTMQHVCFVITINPALISLYCWHWQQVIQFKSFLDRFCSLLDNEVSLVLTPEKKTVYFPFLLLIIRFIIRLHPRSQFNILIQEEHVNLRNFWPFLKREVQKTIRSQPNTSRILKKKYLLGNGNHYSYVFFFILYLILLCSRLTRNFWYKILTMNCVLC
jgi:hypothetical protein